ncbi:MAG: GNAT family N-acetyltransferase [Anaerolineaceae bacterium]|nr:GNAT family N-acetyltransferase [Anaerolineaceae bacterium]MBN2676865.1 GNAT family N-acetyltransferase [Anaerolineaceae bacterium]
MSQLQPVAYQPGDLTKLVDFIFRIRKPEELARFPTGVDFEEVMDSPQVRDLTRLWQDDCSKIIAYAYIDPRYCNFSYEIDTLYKTAQMHSELIGWGICTFRQLKGGGKVDQGNSLDTNCDERDTLRVNTLRSSGFIPQDLMTLHLSRSLSEPIPPIQLPDGFTIRPVSGEQEVDALVALYHDAYGSEIMKRDDVLSIMRTTSYDRELDLVVVSPGGRLAGLCTCNIEEELSKVLPHPLGSTDPVLVHPDFQGKGIARALIWSGWEKLKSRGIEQAELSTSSQNSKGIAAFTKAGYRIDGRLQWFSHPVS